MTSEGLLIEVSMGVFENRPEQEWIEWKRAHGSRFHPSGESKSAVDERVARLVSKLQADHAGQDVLLVTHGTFISHLFAAVFGEVDWAEYCEAFRDGRRILELRSYDQLPTEPTTGDSNER